MPKTVIPRRVAYSAWADGRRRPFPQPGGASPAVLHAEFGGLSLVQTNSYTNGIERRLSGTDSVTGQTFTNIGPGLYSATSPMILQALGFNPGTDWQVEVVTNAPGNRTALRIRRTVAYSQPPAHQVAARMRPGVIWSGQGEIYFRVKWFMPAAFPVGANGFFMLSEVKCNGSDETEDRIAWLMTREPFNGADRFFSKLAATWTNGTPQGVWTPSTPVTPAQDSAILSSFYNQGAFTDSDGLTLPERGRYVTTEIAICLQDSIGRVTGNRQQGYVVCASSVGTATAPPANGTGLVRHRVLGRNMSLPFAAADPSGIGIAFPFNVYSDMPIEGLDFFIDSVEVYDYVPADASFASPNATVPAPVWTGTPAPPLFIVGTPAAYSLAQLISGPQPAQYTLSSIGAALPASVTINNTDKTLVYDGGGSASLFFGIRLRATSSGGPADSAVFPVVLAAPQPNVAALPLAEYQRVPWELAATVRAASSGHSWLDPNTGARVTKITDAATPHAHPTWGSCHAYSENGPFVSRQWGGNRHTIVYWTPGGAPGVPLVDYTYGGGVSNFRLLPVVINLETGVCFSRNPATPRKLYTISGRTMRAWDTATGQEIIEAHLPRTFTAAQCPGTSPTQIGSDGVDGWFAFLDGTGGGTATGFVLFNRLTGETRYKPYTAVGFFSGGIQASTCVIGGRFVFIALEGNGITPYQNGCWYDIQTDSFSAEINSNTFYVGHSSIAWDSFQGALDGPPGAQLQLQNHYAVPILSPGQALQPSQVSFVGLPFPHTSDYHMSAFAPSGNRADQWALFSAHGVNFPATVGAWVSEGGGVYSAPITSYGGGYGRGSVYKNMGVWQKTTTASPTTIGVTMEKAYTRVASLAALTGDDQFFHDATADRIYARSAGGANLTSRLYAECLARFHCQLALARFSDGEYRLLCSSLSYRPTGGGGYFQNMPKGSLSPDGLLVIFSSGMGVHTGDTGRGELFAVEVPRA